MFMKCNKCGKEENESPYTLFQCCEDKCYDYSCPSCGASCSFNSENPNRSNPLMFCHKHAGKCN